MAQALIETIFDICYLVGVVIVGIIMFTRGNADPLVRKFGIMSVLLGAGDAFHLIPRMYALWTTGLEANAAALGIGKLVTSITMTLFYLILYYIWRDRYDVHRHKGLSVSLWSLTAARIVLCLLPQNDWLSHSQPLLWGVLRNIPFIIMGIIIIAIYAQKTTISQDKVFRFMPLAITLSFAFYIPVVLFASIIPMLGMLMIPKTLTYVWIVMMGWKLYKQSEYMDTPRL